MNLKKGESGGGSYVENPSGSFQCNLKDGGTIKCPDIKSPCTYTSKISLGGDVEIVVHLATVGALELANHPWGRPIKPEKAIQHDEANVHKEKGEK